MLNVSTKVKLGHMLDKMEDIRIIVTSRALVRTLNNLTPKKFTCIELWL
jgi:hypothetical protein